MENRLNNLTTRFVIFGQGRSGTSLLVDLINSHPNIHCYGEIFNPQLSIFNYKIFFPKFRLKILKVLSPKKIKGFKLLQYQINRFKRNDNYKKNFLYYLYKKDWKIIYLKRRNILLRVISKQLMQQTGIINQTNNLFKLKKIKLNLDNLLIKIKNSEKNMLYIERELLKKIPHLTLIYEDNLLRNKNHKKTLNKVFDYLGVKRAPIKKTKYHRITSDKISDFIENYEEFKKIITNGPYAKFLYDK